MKRVWLCAGLALAACKSSDPAPEASAGKARRAVSPPAEAVDLDPDPDVVQVELTAARREDGAYAFAYNGQNPGPTIRAKVGDELVVTLVNQLDAPTTIHWHGAGAPFEMDGVPWMRDPTAPGGTFEYRFPLNKPGTFWYHPHFDTSGQVEGGLYGALVVTDPAEPSPDEDLVLIFDAADELLPSGPRPAHGHGKLVTKWRINGAEDGQLTLPGGASVRARIVNAANAGFLALRWPGMRVIGNDQGLLAAAESPELLLLGPGDRADVEWSVGEDAFTVEALPYTLNGGLTSGDPKPVLQVNVDSPAPAPTPLAWPFDGAAPSPDPGHTDIVYALAGSDRTGRWVINGETFPNVTIEEVALGEVVIVEVRNLSPTEHPFHMHGQPFEVLSINGEAPPRRRIEDTINVGIRDVVRLRLPTINPGDWMVHCHILPHADDGMMTVLRVRE